MSNPKTCTTHHAACACREAAHAEEVAVLRRELDEVRVACAAYKAAEGEMAERLKLDGRPIRPQVLWFARQMERKLRENDHKGGWEDCSPSELVSRIGLEYTEILVAMQQGSRRAMADEAADVANFAMMIADNACNHWPPLKRGAYA